MRYRQGPKIAREILDWGDVAEGGEADGDIEDVERVETFLFKTVFIFMGMSLYFMSPDGMPLQLVRRTGE
ncbi:hypothetical protein K432DRAFT_384752 [Lepidopterella palustris CBS 459.81]|uniref:Uncharacterized protein n=1 Tax=Lepidopterella palustris CBS 459.81 TaxID=1314670 RepID=A0A8E2E4P9_9PEZI|nr:hypothetical protein K432DRAFT_384752 [Lepidopterella palustris CBS 459.81]